MVRIEQGWKEKGHEPGTPPSTFIGHPQEILSRRFEWRQVGIGERVVLTALDAESKEPGDFYFEVLGKRKRRIGIGDEILIRFVGGSDTFHFYTQAGKSTIPLDSEGLIGICRGESLTMLDVGGVSRGRHLTFEKVEGLPEEAKGYCVAREILDGHHLIPNQPPKTTIKSREAFSRWSARRRRERILGRVLKIQKRISEGERRLRLGARDVAILDKDPGFDLRQSGPMIENIGLATWGTSLPGVLYQKQWTEFQGTFHRLIIRKPT
jgi:hypothetical protein